MVHIKVVKASRLCLIFAAALLLTALIVFAAFYASGSGGKEVNNPAAASGGLPAQGRPLEAVEALPALSGNVIVFGSPYEDEHTDDITSESFTIEVLPAPEEEPSEEVKIPKRVLIYHTHTHEAYSRSASDEYVEDSAWRTGDERYSVVRVGDELTQLLSGFGIEAVHDKTDHEPPKLATAYARSLETLKKYDGENFDLYIDLHRDAYDESMIQTRAVSVGGSDAARLMVLIGNGEGFDEKPNTAQNMLFAGRLTERLNTYANGICRDVMVKVGRYNQHIGTPAILIEVGHNQNTLKEALASMPVLARAISEILTEDRL